MANIRGFWGAAGAAVLASLAMSSAALADGEPAPTTSVSADDRKFGYSITITGVSDYLFRGISLTNNKPAFQPFIEFTYGKPALTWYLDFWGSNVKDGFGDPWELDVYAGVRPVTGMISWDFAALLYTNPSHHATFLNPNNDNTAYVEFQAKASITPITNLTLTGIAFATPDQGFAYGQTETGEIDAAYALPAHGIFTPTLSGAIGYTTADRAFQFTGGCEGGATSFTQCSTGTDNYWYWNAGVKLAADKFFMDLRYWDTSIPLSADEKAYAQAKFLFSFGVNLP